MFTERSSNWVNAAFVIAVGLVLSSFIFGWFFAKSRRGDESVTVTGSAKKRIKSDLVVWSADVSYQASQIADAYTRLSGDIPKVKQYLIAKGVAENQITVSAITTTTLKRTDSSGNDTGEITGYVLRQSLEVRSNEVDKIAAIARQATELINQGVMVESSAPKFYFTGIGDLKVEMLGEAASDAKARAVKIASSTGDSVGAVKNARMGVMQITAADSTEVSDYGIYDTSTIDKDVTAVVNISFAVN